MELYALLDERKNEIKPEVQHQIYGAINEIDIFLKTLDYYKQKDSDKEIRSSILITPMVKESKLSKLAAHLNQTLSKIKIGKKKQ